MEYFYKTISKLNFTVTITVLYLLFCLSTNLYAQENNDEVLYIEEVTINVDSQEVIELDLKEFGDVISFDELILNENFVESKEQLSINIYSFNYPYRNLLINTTYANPYFYDILFLLANHDKDLYYKYILNLTNIADPNPNTVKSVSFMTKIVGINNQFTGIDVFIHYQFDPLTSLSERNWYYAGIQPFYDSKDLKVFGELSLESDSINSVFNADLTFSYAFNLSPSFLSIALQYKSKGSSFVSFSPGLLYQLTFEDKNSLSMLLYYDISANVVFPSVSFIMMSPFILSLSAGRYYGEIAKLSAMQYFFINNAYSMSIDDYVEVKAYTIIKDQSFLLTINTAYRHYYTLVHPFYIVSLQSNITAGNLNDISSVYLDLILSIPIDPMVSFEINSVSEVIFSNNLVHDPFSLHSSLNYNFSSIFTGKLKYDTKLFRYDNIGSMDDFHSLGIEFLYQGSITKISLAGYYFITNYKPLRDVIIPYQWYIAISLELFL